MNGPESAMLATATRKAPAGARGFYIIDADSESYFVGKVYRAPHEIGPDLAALEIGATLWTSESRGFERFQ